MKVPFRHIVYSIGMLSCLAIIIQLIPFLATTAATTPMTIGTKLTQLQLNYQLDEKGKFVTFIAPGIKPIVLKKKPASATAIGTQFWKDFGTYFGVKQPAKELKLLETTKDNLGLTHMRYIQAYNNVPVFGGEMVVNLKSTNDIAFVNGHFIQGLNIRTTPKIKQKTADANAVLHIKKTLGRKEIKALQRTLYVLQPTLLDPSLPPSMKLAWEVLLGDQAGREYVYVDAQTGKIIWRGTDTKTISRSVIDCRPDNGCFTGMQLEGDTMGRGEHTEPAADAEIDDLFNNLGGAHRYFSTTFNLNGANGIGGIGDGLDAIPQQSTTALSYFIPTSTWPGCPNAFNAVTMTFFCQGTVDPTIVGHEYGHSVNHFQASSPLIYAGESGAIEEAYADIWGQAITRNITGNSPWTIGVPGERAWRDLSNPNTLGDPASFYDANFACTSTYTPENDFGYVHHNSNVISHIAYLLSNGGALNDCTIPSIGQDKAERLFFASLRSVTKTTRFNEFASIMNGTCDAIYGANSTECRAVRTAIEASEINQYGPCRRLLGIPFPKRAPSCSIRIIPLPEPINTVDIPGSTITTSTVLTDPVVEIPPVITNAPSIPTPEPEPQIETPVVQQKPAPVLVERDRTPNFSIDGSVSTSGNTATINGTIDSYGVGDTCVLPRPFDPVIIRWDDGTEDILTPSGSTFSMTHMYTKHLDKKSYSISVSIWNGCYGSFTQRYVFQTPAVW